MAAFSTLLPDVLPHVPECPNVLALFEIKRAAQDFFRTTRGWQVIEDPVAVVAGTETLQVTPADANQELVEVLTVKWDGDWLEHLTPETLDRRFGEDWESDTGTPRWYTMLQTGLIRFYPTPSANTVTGVVTRNIVTPSEAATEIPDALMLEYRDAIMIGARSRLMVYPEKPWTNANTGIAYGQLFQQHKDKFNAKAAKAHGRARILSRINWC